LRKAITPASELLLHFPIAHLFKIAGQAVTGIVDEYVDPAKSLQRFADCR
jgi:hypothetical protein